jgi:hypothetical protein
VGRVTINKQEDVFFNEPPPKKFVVMICIRPYKGATLFHR